MKNDPVLREKNNFKIFDSVILKPDWNDDDKVKQLFPRNFSSPIKTFFAVTVKPKISMMENLSKVEWRRGFFENN